MRRFSEPAMRLGRLRLLLDLHNLYTNCRNHNGSYAFLERLNLDHVVEIISPVAGARSFYPGRPFRHEPGSCLGTVGYRAAACRNRGGVVFELLGSWYVDVGEDRLAAELSRMKELWARHQPMRQPGVAA